MAGTIVTSRAKIAHEMAAMQKKIYEVRSKVQLFEYQVPKPSNEQVVNITARKIEQPVDQSTKADSEMWIPQATPIATGIKLITTKSTIS